MPCKLFTQTHVSEIEKCQGLHIRPKKKIVFLPSLHVGLHVHVHCVNTHCNISHFNVNNSNHFDACIVSVQRATVTCTVLFFIEGF